MLALVRPRVPDIFTIIRVRMNLQSLRFFQRRTVQNSSLSKGRGPIPSCLQSRLAVNAPASKQKKQTRIGQRFSSTSSYQVCI